MSTRTGIRKMRSVAVGLRIDPGPDDVITQLRERLNPTSAEYTRILSVPLFNHLPWSQRSSFAERLAKVSTEYESFPLIVHHPFVQKSSKSQRHAVMCQIKSSTLLALRKDLELEFDTIFQVMRNDLHSLTRQKYDYNPYMTIQYKPFMKEAKKTVWILNKEYPELITTLRATGLVFRERTRKGEEVDDQMPERYFPFKA